MWGANTEKNLFLFLRDMRLLNLLLWNVITPFFYKLITVGAVLRSAASSLCYQGSEQPSSGDVSRS